jgi:pSer/pThr/pTyr-binding forkhead associated (FHA) protein
MVARFTIQEIRADGRQEVGALDGQELVIGREPRGGNAMVLASDTVSREHGVFSPLRNHWLFKDLGSTNGSWLNGVALKEGQWKIIRPGDVLQLADRAIQLSGPAEQSGIGLRSLLVFHHGDFLDEYPIPEAGRAIAIGGSKADLKLDVDVNDHPSLVVERRGDRVCAFSVAKEVAIYVNDQEITRTVQLNDRDEVRVGTYTVILNDPPEIPAGEQAAEVPAGDSGGYVVPAADWQTARSAASNSNFRPSARPLFGQEMEHGGEEGNITQTIALDPKAIQTRLRSEGSPSMRHAALGGEPGEDEDNPGDRAIKFFGMVLLMAILFIAMYWLFFVG